MKLNLLMSAALAPMILAPLALPAHADVDAVVATSAAVAGDVIYGRVTNAAGAPLPGAEVLVRGTGQRAVTNTQGEFTLPTASGQIVLDVRYLGLPSTSQTVTTTPGENANVAIVLGSASATDVADVIVTGVITDGVARSLNQQKNAQGTVNVLSADAIGRYPDPNVAESLQRVQGIAIQRDQGEGRYINVRGAPSSFTAVSVDGVAIPAVSPTTRAVDLDTLPSDIVSTVEVSKTLRPSQDADSIAGAVDIKTRSPFDKRRLAIGGYAGGSYNDYGGSDRRAGATASNVFGPDQTFGALVSVSYSETNRRPDNVENGWMLINRTPAQGGGQIWGLENTLFKDYETERTRKAVTGALEWRPSDATRVWLKGSYAQFRDEEFRNTLNLTYSDGVRYWGHIATDVVEPYGFCFARRGAEIHAILVGHEGELRQFILGVDAAGKPTAREVRRAEIGAISEGCAADEATDALYINEENVGLWRYGLNPASGATRTLIQPIARDILVADAEGLTTITDASGRYLIASSQGDSTFPVWRIDGAAPQYKGRFKVVDGTVDGITGTDGLAAASGQVGPFPEGLVVIQDDVNDVGTQNFKYVDWRDVRRALGL